MNESQGSLKSGEDGRRALKTRRSPRRRPPPDGEKHPGKDLETPERPRASEDRRLAYERGGKPEAVTAPVPKGTRTLNGPECPAIFRP